jgi:radical SAM superfamily enzyme YgiQ (UPF0313 family)
MRNVVFISDNPMTLGIQFLIGYLREQTDLSQHFSLSAVMSGVANFSKIEAPYSESELNHLRDFLRSRAPVVVGISTIERTRPRLLSTLPELRRVLPGAIFISGGVDAVSAPELYLDGGVDMVAYGDGETPVARLLNRLLEGDSRENIIEDPPQGFLTKTRKDFTPARSPEKLPLPYYGDELHRLTAEGVFNFSAFPRNPQHVQFLNRTYAVDMYTQRGCTHQCSFCAQDLLNVYRDDSLRNSRKRSLDEVANYLHDLKVAFPHTSFVYFWDLDFLRRPRHELKEFAESYRQLVALPFFIFCTEKSVNSAGTEVLGALVGSGLKTINMGLQSGSERVLKEFYKRNNTPQESREAIGIIHRATRETDVEILYDVITYNPDETPDEILETINLISKIPTDGKQTIRLSTHKLSFNTGQALSTSESTRTKEDYQDFITNIDIYQRTQSPYLSWLLGQMLRGEVTKSRLGSVRREYLPRLVKSEYIARMDADKDLLSTIYKAFVPRDNEAFTET